MAAFDEPPGATRVDPAAAAGEAWRVFRARYPMLLKAWTLPVVVQLVGNLLMWSYLARQGITPEVLDAWPPALSLEQQMVVLGVGLPLAFATALATFVGWGLVAREVRRAVLPDETPARPVPWGPLAMLAAALVLVYAAGVAFLLVPFFIFFHWFLYAPAALVDRREGTGDAFEASRRFARERRAFGFTALVLLVWLGLVFVRATLGGVLATVLTLAGAPDALLLAAVSPLAGWLVMPLLPVLPAAYWFLAQKGAPAAEDAQQAEPAKGASAAERFRTTKCPQCGTLVPYTATGKPVDVTCPVCGRSGRVL